jgi:hypothetical protein
VCRAWNDRVLAHFHKSLQFRLKNSYEMPSSLFTADRRVLSSVEINMGMEEFSEMDGGQVVDAITDLFSYIGNGSLKELRVLELLGPCELDLGLFINGNHFVFRLIQNPICGTIQAI